MTLMVSPEVVDAVRQHALEVDRERPGHESIGVLVRDGETVVRYARLHNAETRWPWMAVLATPTWQLSRPGRGGPGKLVVTHSHPVGPATPSEQDMRWIATHGWDMIGIFGLEKDELRLWALDGEDGHREVEFSVSGLSTAPRPREGVNISSGRDSL